MNSKLAGKKLSTIPSLPPRFSLSEWNFNNRVIYNNTAEQQLLAERVLIECQKARQKTAEIAELNKTETNHCIEERINDIEFKKNETERQRKEVLLEIDALDTYKERIIDAIKPVKDKALILCKKCIVLREGRLGIDLVHDEVERELLKEAEIIQGSQVLLERTLKQIIEQIRKLRSAVYFIDRDLKDKTEAVKLDNHIKTLTQTSLNQNVYRGNNALDCSNITIEEWESVTSKNFHASAKEINNSVAIRSYIDTLLKHIIEDLCHQYNAVSEAFKRRIEETRDAKSKLENQRYEITKQINEMIRNITELENSITEKESYIILAHTRLGNRTQRPDLELCKDIVESKLMLEIKELTENITYLQEMITETQVSLRYLHRTQVQIEEDINIKSNTLKIDEVDCMSLRESMDYHSY